MCARKPCAELERGPLVSSASEGNEYGSTGVKRALHGYERDVARRRCEQAGRKCVDDEQLRVLLCGEAYEVGGAISRRERGDSNGGAARSGSRASERGNSFRQLRRVGRQ